MHRPGEDATLAIDVASNHVTPGYFAALRIPILRGRNFTDTEALGAADGTCGPVIASASLARRFFGEEAGEEAGENAAVGRDITLPRNALHARMDCPIVGVAADVRWGSPAEAPAPFLYRPFTRDPFGGRTAVILVRSAQPPAQIAARLRETAASLDPAIPLSQERALFEALESRMAEQRLTSMMLSLLALLGFVLAAVGLYGLVAETVAERTREFGIRMAIGADASRIFRTVLTSAGWLAFAGLATGIPMAVLLARMLRSQLFGVTALDPSTYAAAAALLAVVVLLGGVLPSRAARASIRWAPCEPSDREHPRRPSRVVPPSRLYCAHALCSVRVPVRTR